MTADVLTTDLQGELILMDAAQGVMFSLNATGRQLWQALPATTATLTQLLQNHYGLLPQQAQQDVQEIMSALQERQLVIKTQL